LTIVYNRIIIRDWGKKEAGKDQGCCKVSLIAACGGEEMGGSEDTSRSVKGLAAPCCNLLLPYLATTLRERSMNLDSRFRLCYTKIRKIRRTRRYELATTEV